MNNRDYIKHTEPYHFRLCDFKQMAPGNSVCVVMWDRNYQEVGKIWNRDRIVREQEYKAREMFKFCKTVVEKVDDSKMTIYFPSLVDPVEHYIHMNTTGFAGCDFDWYPMDGSRPDLEEQVTPETRIGWRGPMMRWDWVGDELVFEPDY